MDNHSQHCEVGKVHVAEISVNGVNLRLDCMVVSGYGSRVKPFPSDYAATLYISRTPLGSAFCQKFYLKTKAVTFEALIKEAQTQSYPPMKHLQMRHDWGRCE